MAGPSISLPANPLVAFFPALGFWALYNGPLDVLSLVGLIVLRNLPAVLAIEDLGTILPLPKILAGAALGLTVFYASRALWVAADTPRWSGPGKVLLFPCKTIHARVFPKTHSFSYSYLVVGVPVGWEGNAGGMVSVGAKEQPSSQPYSSPAPSTRRGWYNINAADYLERGYGHLGLRGKLDKYLTSQGADPALYPYAYLITAAKFLGYHFNPVSFWYLYDAEKNLAAMILEVNNTFDERRMYYLTPSKDSESEVEHSDHSHTEEKSSQASPSLMFKQRWPKDFHVSPFNSRKGSYTLSAQDPLRPFMQGVGPVNCTINLLSSKGHGKLVARLLPDGAAIDPYAMSVVQKLVFLASWWGVGFITFPRIVHQAAILFFQRKLHVWYRPEPLKKSMGRNADPTEKQLELIFRKYLRHLVEQVTTPLALKYVPGGISENASELMLSPLAREGSTEVEELDFKVLTPVFYTRFIGYAHDLEALFCEFRENGTIWVSKPDLLPKLVLKQPSPTLQSHNLVEFAYFKTIQALRARPERIERPLTSSALSTHDPTKSVTDIRGFRISSMDGFVLASEDDASRKIYRSCLVKLFVADRIALGSVPLLEGMRFMAQACISWAVSGAVGALVAQIVR